MPYNTKNLKRDASNIPIPQYFDNDADDFQPLDNGMNIKEVQVMVPTEQQAKYATTIQIHSATSIAATTGQNTSAFQDISGFTELAVTMNVSVSGPNQVELVWSHDGTTPLVGETILASSTRSSGLARTKRAARYVAIRLYNTDASARTYNSWLDLTV